MTYCRRCAEEFIVLAYIDEKLDKYYQIAFAPSDEHDGCALLLASHYYRKNGELQVNKFTSKEAVLAAIKEIQS